MKMKRGRSRKTKGWAGDEEKEGQEDFSFTHIELLASDP